MSDLDYFTFFTFVVLIVLTGAGLAGAVFLASLPRKIAAVRLSDRVEAFCGGSASNSETRAPTS